ncbi:MAG TPA: hypothetical protein VGK33_16610 [Chloroflexota bacterium]
MLAALYAAVSAYWGAGGTALLDTIGGTLEREGRARSAGLLAVVWLTVLLKLAAVVLVLYGGVLTLIGLLVQADVVHASAHADHTALRWHAFLWDPWFLLWGLLLAAALTRRAGSPDAATVRTGATPSA